MINKDKPNPELCLNNPISTAAFGGSHSMYDLNGVSDCVVCGTNS